MQRILQCFTLPFLLLTISATANACRGGESNPVDSFEKAYGKASIAFIGKVVSINSSTGNDVDASFEIVKSWKGAKNGKLNFFIQTGRSCDLGRYVEVGTKWFLLANKAGEVILTASHSRRLFDKSEEDELVKAIEKVK